MLCTVILWDWTCSENNLWCGVCLVISNFHLASFCSFGSCIIARNFNGRTFFRVFLSTENEI